MSTLLTVTVTSIVLLTMGAVAYIFIAMYTSTMEESAVISSEQAVVQAMNTVGSYTEDMDELMGIIENNIFQSEEDWNDFIESLLEVRTELVAVSNYNTEGELIGCWSGYLEIKEEITENLSHIELEEDSNLTISKPHVESLFVDEYPWVVTISKQVIYAPNQNMQISMDISFSQIASYVDDVGIGQHGYCFIMDSEGNIIYHPQQRLIYSGIKSEDTELLTSYSDGSYILDNVIYTVHSLENYEWRIVGVSYVDEMITNKVKNMIEILIVVLALVLMTTLFVCIIFAKYFTDPAKRLQLAMKEFEKEAENFQYVTVGGTKEILKLSDSFGHMVIRIQRLMEQVRQEEISLRKTELNALQAQINPHFLYNTLDSIAWMCEEERTEEAVEMVNALAKLFRISISRGHEMITIEKELEHAKSYLKIQNYRYKNQFAYYLDIDETCLGYMCNKITLQPIIENCIYHGLNRMVDEGEIYIRITQTETDILMSVEDNGVGMSEELCEEILMRESSDRVGIGIKNVHDRIRIYFGETYGLKITSELDEGTKVEIRMPKVEEGDYEN